MSKREESQCNLCGHDRYRVLLKDSKPNPWPHDVVYHYCTRCSFVTLDIDIDDQIWYSNACDNHSDDQMYKYMQQEQAETWSVIKQLFSFMKEYGKIVNSVLDGTGKILCDVGAGAGGSLLTYKSLGWNAVGIEPGKRQGQYARDVCDLDLRTDHYTRASFSAESLDMIHSYHVIEHVRLPYTMLGDFAYHLRPGGLLYIETPDVTDTERDELGFGHISMFTQNTLIFALKSSGFEIIFELDRSAFSSNAIGILARKRTDLESDVFRNELVYVPVTQTNWRRDNYLKLVLAACRRSPSC